MLVEEKRFQILCDGCSTTFHFGNKISFKDEKTALKRVNEDIDWHTPDEEPMKHYCPHCWAFDKKQSIIIIPREKQL